MGHSSKLPSLPINRFSLPQAPSSDSLGHPLYENRDAIASAMPQGVRRHSAAGTEEVPSPSRQGAKTLQNGTPGKLHVLGLVGRTELFISGYAVMYRYITSCEIQC